MARFADFIIAGAPRSGTTWLYELLARHPKVHMARPAAPEPKFFLVDEIYQRGLPHYARWFAEALPGQLAGEKSTNYLESAVAARRIHAHLPQVKLIFILRNPVERAYSNYLWSRMNGLETEEFTAALALEAQREQSLAPHLRFARPFSYFARGLYADLLRPYLELFPRRQILFLRFEDIVENSVRLSVGLSEFLAVEIRLKDVIALGRVNVSEKITADMPVAARNHLTAAYSEPNRRLARVLGEEFEIWERCDV